MSIRWWMRPEGSEHSFDLKKGAEAPFGELFDEAVEFLRDALAHA
jgi:hypothetical protein